MSNQADPHHRLGRSMFIIAWLLFFVLLALLFGRWEQQQSNPNRDVNSRLHQGVAELVLEANRQNHYVFSGKINDVTVDFLVDTGATHVSVPEHIAERLSLPKGYPMQASTANGVVTVYATRIDRLQLGAIVLHNVRANINPGMRNDDILLGMSALRDLTLIQRDRQLILRQQVHGR